MEAGLALTSKQVEDLTKFIQYERFLNSSHCGTGKTPIACVYTEYEVNTNKNTVVWIQPTSLIGKNVEEILRWCDIKSYHLGIVEGTKKAKLELCNTNHIKVFFTTADAWASEYGNLIRKNYNPKVLICDEPQMYYRNWLSKRTQVFAGTLKPYTKVKFLTATPTPHGNLAAAYIYCHVIQQDYYKHYKYFMQIHAIYDEFGKICAWEQHETLKALLDFYSVTRTTKETYGEQEKHIVRKLVPMCKAQHELYTKFEATGVMDIKKSIMSDKNAESQTTLRLRQILNSPHKIKLPIAWNDKGEPTDYEIASVIENNEELTNKEKDLLAYLNEGEPLAIFGVFENELKHIHHVLTKAGFKGELINGSVSGSKRSQIDTAFQAGELDYVTCSVKTAGMGYNWGFLNTIIFHSMDYGDDEFVQACHRAIRGKRTQTLRVILLEYVNSIEPLILWKVHQKSKNTNKIKPEMEIIRFPNLDESIMQL